MYHFTSTCTNIYIKNIYHDIYIIYTQTIWAPITSVGKSLRRLQHLAVQMEERDNTQNSQCEDRLSLYHSN